MRGSRAWYAVAAAAAAAAYLALDGRTVPQMVLYEVVTLAGLAGVVAGVRRHRPSRPHAWVLLGAGAALSALGDAVWFLLHVVLGDTRTPSLADVFYLPAYGFLAAGLLVVIRGRAPGRDRAGLLDACIVAIGVSVLFWVLIIVPTAGDTTLTPFQRAAATAYPCADVLLLALVGRLLTTPGARSPSYWLVVAALASSLVANTGYAVTYVVLGLEVATPLLDLGWLLFPLLLGAAALDPTMSRLTDADVASEARLGRGRLALLAVASLLAPGTQLVQVALQQEVDAVTIALGSCALFLLVLARLAGLLQRIGHQAELLSELSRLDPLTRLPNRRTWEAELERACRAAADRGDGLVLGLVDLDHFKAYNDARGHQAGDRLLAGAAAAWQDLLPVRALLARYGGEEFGVLLPGCDLATGRTVLDRLRTGVPEGQTLSAGVVEWDGREHPHALVARADAALYRAKAEGRDRVVAGAGAPPVPAPRPGPAAPAAPSPVRPSAGRAPSS